VKRISGELLNKPEVAVSAVTTFPQPKMKIELNTNFINPLLDVVKKSEIESHEKLEVWKIQGAALLQEEQYEEAIAIYEKALQFDPENHQIWYQLGNAVLRLGQYDAANNYWKFATCIEALKRNPDDYQAWGNRGNALSAIGRKEEAIASYDRALSINPDYYEAWNGQGFASSKLGREEEAITSYDRALSINPDFYIAWFNRGIALYAIGRKEEAIASYDRALSINPDFYGAWSNRGSALSNLGRNKEAITSYDRALSINPDDYLSWSDQGIALFNLGRNEEAIASCDRALSINPDYYEAWNNRGLALSKLGKHEEAIISFDCALSINLDSHEAWNGRGGTLSELGRNEEAIISFDCALSINLDDYLSWNNRGVALSKLGKHEEAIISFDRALSINPDYYEAWNNRGLALSKLGKHEEAIASFDRALSINPAFYQAWFNRGIVASSSLQPELNMALFLPKGLAQKAMGSIGTERALVSFDAGIAYCDSQSPEHIEGRGSLHWSKGDIYFARGAGARDYRTQFVRAIASFEAALNEWKEEQYKYRFGEDYLEILFSLIRIRTRLGETELANTLRREGTELYKRLLETSEANRHEKLIRQFSSRFQDLTISDYVQNGQFIEALETAENDKNQCLAWLFADNEIPVLNYAEMQQLLDQNTAIIFWHLSDYALTTFLLLPNASQPLGFSAFPVNGEPEFETWQRQWQTDYETEVLEDSTANFLQWVAGMDSRCEKLRELLNINAIQAKLQEYPDINQLLLVPHRTLHLYPLHTLFDAKYLITHVPSIQIGLELQLRQSTQAHTRQLLAIANPKHQITITDAENNIETSKKVKNLRFAESEGKAICQAISNSQLLTGETATLERLTQELSDNPTAILHFSCHGKHDPEKPENSRLYLSHTDTLSFKQIPSLPLTNCQLAYLSACETGMTANKTIRNEYIGLTSAFLYAGVPVVVSTLWSIKDVASSLLSIAFYDRYLHPTTGGNAPLALKQAQAWLRDFDRQEYERIYADRSWRQRLSASQWTEVQIAIERDPQPYHSRYYWAGYYTVSYFHR